MDDLDHSVLIAEQDWDSFCIESEECSVQQAKLAALDESGFSDIDDDKTSVYVSSQTSPDQHCEKDCVEGQKQHQIEECKKDHSSDNSEFTEYPRPQTEPQNAEQMSSNRENEPGATFVCQNKANEESNLTEKLNLEKFRGNDENQEDGENKSSQATTEPVSETSSADIKHEESMDGIEMQTEVTDSSPEAKKEKERWFVTVNDSPVRLRVKSLASVQKKRRKKKTSKSLSQNNEVMEKCSSLNNNTEPGKEIIDRQTMQDEFEQENVFPDSPNFQNVLQIQDILCISPIRSCESEGEKSSCAISLKKESMTEIPEELERNHADSLNLLLTPKLMPEEIFKDLSGPLPQYYDHENTACDKYDKSRVDNNSECRHTTNNGRGEVVESPKFLMGASNPTAPSDTEGEITDQKEPLGQSYNREEVSLSSQETQSSSNSAKDSRPTRPIFAISSFWDEMEKLTINDILQIRIANNRSLLTESSVQEEIGHVDTVDTHLLYRSEVESKEDSLDDSLVDDAEDSDYFTHLDDSKPDRSSCEFSTFSDFDDELINASANPSPEPLEGQEQTKNFLDSTFPMDLEETWRSESNEIINLCTKSDSALFSETEAEMPDIFLTTKEDNNMSPFLLDHCSMRRSAPSPVLSISNILDDQCLLSFFEILKSDNESEQYQTLIPDRNTLLCFSQKRSVAETYDDFFSDFEVGNFLFPPVQASTKSEKTLVPIYSSSRSVVKDLEFPEAENVIQLNDEDKFIRVMRCASPSETSNMCFITGQRSTWRNLSLRHTKLLMGRTWCRMATFSDFTQTADTVYRYGTKTSSRSSIAQPQLPVVLLENQALGQLREYQIQKHQLHVGATVADTDRDCFLFSLKQADMCLVCIAFASWVLKSSDPQSTDMWKAALLANVSAISAIQYLRRYIKEG